MFYKKQIDEIDDCIDILFEEIGSLKESINELSEDLDMTTCILKKQHDAILSIDERLNNKFKTKGTKTK